MSFSISNTSASAVITDITTPSSVTGELTITSGSLPLSVGGMVSGTNTTLDNQKGSPYGTFQMFLQQGDAQIDTYVNNTLYSSEKYSSGIVEIQTPIIQSGDSLTMAISDVDFDCYNLTPNFSGTGINTNATEIIEQPDGKLIFAGLFQNYKGEDYSKIIRLNPDFSIDTSFVVGSGFAATTSSINTMALQSDGKILVGGTFTGYNGTNIARIVRLNSDGSIDTTFQSGTGATGTITSIVVQPDNKILVAGNQFIEYSGVSLSGITRLEANGSIDATFSANVSTTLPIFAISLQSDGKIVIGGGFTSVNGVSINRIARLNNDGTTDTTFSAGTGFNLAVQTLSVESDGKIIVGGFFSGYSGSASSRIVRLNTDGTIDGTFVVGSGFGTAVSGLIQVWSINKKNGKYVVTGVFGDYQGETNNAIVRLNNDGSIDTTFDTDGGFSGFTAAQPTNFIKSDGEIIVTNRGLGSYKGQSLTNLAVLAPFGQLLNCE